jgi:hypothetical protein
VTVSPSWLAAVPSPLRDTPVIEPIALALASRLDTDLDILLGTVDMRRPGHLAFEIPAGPSDARVLTRRLPFVRTATVHGTRLDLTLDAAEVVDVVGSAEFADDLAAWARRLAAGKTAVVEHTSINPVHPVHLGALRGSFVGTALVGLLRTAGASARAHFFVNDLGRQAGELARAVSLTGWQHPGVSDEDFADYIGGIYAAAHLALNGRHDAFQALLSRRPELADLSGWSQLRADDRTLLPMEPALLHRMLHSIRLALGRFGIHIDSWDHESDYIHATTEAVALIRRTFPVQLINGALCCQLPGGLIPVRRPDRTSLYFARDVAYMFCRARHCDLAVNVVGEDQYLTQSALLRLARNADGGRLRYVPIGWVNDPDVRFSARRGHLISVNDLFRTRTPDELRALRINLLRSAAWRRHVLTTASFSTAPVRYLRRQLDRPAAGGAPAARRSVDAALGGTLLATYPALVRAVDGLRPHRMMNHALKLAVQMSRAPSSAASPAARTTLAALLTMLGVDVTGDPSAPDPAAQAGAELVPMA